MVDVELRVVGGKEVIEPQLVEHLVDGHDAGLGPGPGLGLALDVDTELVKCHCPGDIESCFSCLLAEFVHVGMTNSRMFT